MIPFHPSTSQGRSSDVGGEPLQHDREDHLPHALHGEPGQAVKGVVAPPLADGTCQRKQSLPSIAKPMRLFPEINATA